MGGKIITALTWVLAFNCFFIVQQSSVVRNDCYAISAKPPSAYNDFASKTRRLPPLHIHLPNRVLRLIHVHSRPLTVQRLFLWK